MRIHDLSASDIGELDIARYVVKIPAVKAFVRPTTYSPKARVHDKDFLEKGDTFYGLYKIEGEPIEDIPIWISHIRGGFIWYGALLEIKFDMGLDRLSLPIFPY